MIDAFLWFKWLTSIYDNIFKGWDDKIGDVQDVRFFFFFASLMCICATKMIWFVTSNANQLSVTFIYFSSLETRLFIQEVFVCGRREIIQNIG